MSKMKKSRNGMKQIKHWIDHNRLNTLIIIVSILGFLIGGFTVGWIKSLLIIGLIDLCLFIPTIINKMGKKGKPKTAKEKKATKSKKKKIIKIVLIILFSLFILAMLAVAAFFYMIVKEAPKFNPDNLYKKESSILYEPDGTIFAKLGLEKREKITYDEMPEVLVNAIIATEDSRFFQHNGFDLPRFIKASLGQLLGRDAGGASTLTMQVSKNAFTGTESSGIDGIKRKFTDIYMAIFQIEKNYTKQEILEFYANSYNMGAGAWGVEQASLTYFGKNAKDLTLAEASMIAGLFQAPNTYNPYVNPDLATSRRSTVLYLMQRHGYITQEERDAAEAISIESLLVKTNTSSSQYIAYIDTVIAEVEAKTKKDPYMTPMEIYTNFDRAKQDHINSIVKGETFTWENEKVESGIAVVDTKTGALIAVGGGRKYVAKGLNYATDIEQQIGSTAKPLYDYGPAIEYNNWSTYTPLVDEEHKYSSGNNLNNWDGKFEGFMTLRYALIKSRNIPALKTFQSISNAKIKNFVTSLGLNPELEGGIVHEAHAIGGYNGESPLSVAAAYAAFGNGGYYTTPYTVNKIVFRETGEVYEEKPTKNKVMSEETAYMIADMLVDTAKDALGRYASVNGINYGAKTGTTNFDDKTIKDNKLPGNAIRDLWVASTNTDYSIAIWYGYDKIDPQYISRFGNNQHAKLFQAVAKGVYADKTGFKKPSGVVEVEIEKESYPNAKLPSAYTPADMRIKELFKKGTEPTEVSDRYNSLTNVTNLDSKIAGSTVTLTWDPIKTPNTIDTTYLTEYFKSMYSNPADQTKYLNARVAYNNANIGSLVYKVYMKNADGTLKLLGTTTDPKFEYKATTNQPVTFVVKSSYTIFTSNASSGAELKVSLDGIASVITGQLNGNENMTLTVGDPYKEPSPMVIILENLVDVSNKATVNKTIKRKSDGKTVTEITTTAAETYTITYTVTYQTYKETFTRTVTVKSA